MMDRINASIGPVVPAALWFFVACTPAPAPSTDSGSDVGFTSFTVLDSTRNLRPVQVSMWYPSSQDGSKKLTLADYSRAITVEGTAAAVTPDVAAAGARELRDYLVSLGSTPDGAGNALGMKLTAHEDARGPRSRLPVIVFALGKDESPVLHADLAETIAARGFLVVTAPTVGTRRRTTTWEAEDVFTHSADLNLALRTSAERGWGDTTRLAFLGYSYGSGAAVLLAEEHSATRGMVILDGSIAFRDRLSTFREALGRKRLTVPVLYLGARNDARQDQSLLKTIAPHAVVTLSDSTGHLDFTTLALVATQPGFEGFMRLGDDLLPAGVVYARVKEAVLEFMTKNVLRD